MLPLWASAESTSSAELPFVVASSEAAVVLAPQPAALHLESVLCEPKPSDRVLPIRIAAGMVLVTAAGVIGQVTQSPPAHEARVALAVQGNAGATIDAETQLEVMESPALLEPAVEQLQSRSVDITYESLIQSLTIEAQGETFDIRYRHPDIDTAQAVVEQLSSTYLNHGQTCRHSACRGLQYIEGQIPRVQQQVRADQAQLRRLYRSGMAPEHQAELLSARRMDVRRQAIQVNQRLSSAHRARVTLQERMGLTQSPASKLLQGHGPYQQRLQDLRQIEQQIATEFGRAQADSQYLKALYRQHNSIAAQLNQEAQSGLRRFLDNPRGPVDPVFQQPLYGELLQKLVGIVHQIEVLELRQKTLAQIEATLAQEHRRIASLLSQYEAVKQQLFSSSQILQDYIDRREQLREETALETMAWRLVSPPEVISPEDNSATGVWFSEWPPLYYAGAITGLAAGAIALTLRQRQKTSRAVIEGELI